MSVYDFQASYSSGEVAVTSRVHSALFEAYTVYYSS